MRKKCGSARQICLDMLMDVFEKQAYSNVVMQSAMSATGLSTEDKAFASAMFYGTITRLYSIDYYLNKKLDKDLEKLDPAVRTLLRMGAWQILYSHSVPTFAAVDQTVNLAKQYTNEGASKLINAVLRALSKEERSENSDKATTRFDIHYSLNRELAGCLIKWYGKERAASIASAFLSTPNVTARHNRLRCTRDELIQEFHKEGVTTEDSLFMDEAIRISLCGHSIPDLPSYRNGLFMIQDEAAMLVSHILAPSKGARILDVCAAPGGKSCHIAEITGDQAHIIALDIHESRLVQIEENQKRLGIIGIDTAVADASSITTEHKEYIQAFDGVLADVPCSGLGLLLRKPDIRQKMTYARMQELIPIQAAILREAAECVRPGGRLVYSTCTINPEENAYQAERFLSENKDFRYQSFGDILPERLKEESLCLMEQAQKGQLQLLPDRVGCDRFFIACFRRINDGEKSSL